MNKLYYVETDCTNPIQNLALEMTLLEQLQPQERILYLWQNDNTVVIGKNQNAWKECNLSTMKEDCVTLVRRSSGGGAVYHDLGNLNFTFLVNEEDFDITKQSSVILHALQSFDLPATISGRNDLLLHGQKFSGHAYYHKNNVAFHHGTLLIQSDLNKIARYLNPDPKKVQSKGVESVRNRVTNLIDYEPTLTIPIVKDALKKAFQEIYQAPITTDYSIDEECMRKYISLFESNDWIYGKQSQFQYEVNERYPWGDITLQFQVDNGIIQDVTIYSDAMETDWIEQLQQSFQKLPFQKEQLQNQLLKIAIPHKEDILDVMKKLEI